MKNKKGFTLIELLAVITILGIVVTIIGVSVTKLMQNSKEDVSIIQKREVLKAAKAYIIDNLSSCKSGCTVSTNTLISSGYLDKDESIDGKIVVTKNGNNFSYEYISTVMTGDDSINITNLSPITRSNVLTSAVKKTFKVKNSETKKMYAKITLNNIEISNRLKNYDFVWSLYEGNKNVSNGTFDNVGESITLGEYLVLEPNQEKTYNLYIWLEKTSVGQSSVSGQKFNANIKTNLEEYYTSPESDFVVNERGVLTSYTGNETLVVIPPTVNGITVTTLGNGGDSLFEYTNATKVIIPNTVTKINDFAFLLSKIESLMIPNSVTTLGIAPFAASEYLKEISIPNSITNISSESFGNCNLTSVFIPNSVTTIYASAFVSNNFSGVIIPSSVTYLIDDYLGLFGDNKNSNLIITVQGKSSDPYTFCDDWNKKTEFGTQLFNTVYVP